MRIGLLGAAKITPAAIIHPAKVLGGVHLAAVAARDRQRAAAFAGRHGVRHVLDDYATLVGHPEVDLVYNALPVDAHARWSIAALEAGKHVLCEKPFAMHADEAGRVLDAAAANGVRVVEAFHYRYHPLFATLLGWVRSGRIGRVEQIAARFTVPIADNGTEIRHRPERGGGAMMDLGCYPLHWVLELLDATPDGVAAEAHLGASGVDAAMQVALTFPDGATAQLQADMRPDVAFAATLEIRGSAGSIHCTNPLAPQLGAHLVLDTGGGPAAVPVDRLSSYTHQLRAVLDALASGDQLPTEGAAILRQQACLDRIYNAAKLGHLRTLSDWSTSGENPHAP